MKIVPGPTHILLDWQVPPDGWATNHKVRYNLKKSNFSTNETRKGKENLSSSIEVVSPNPPVMVTELEPESEYTFVIETFAGPHIEPLTFVLKEVSTTANNSQSPEEIIGVSFNYINYFG